MTRVGKSVLLASIGLLGGGIVLAWPILEHKSRAGASTSGHPIISVEEAQRQLDFPLLVPKEVPDGGRLLGVRVYQVKIRDRGQYLATLQAKKRPFTGYGLMITADNGQYKVRSMPGSPAERAGLGKTTVPLVALNDHPIGKKGSPGINSLVGSAGPLRVTFKADDQKLKTVTIEKEHFVTGPDIPDLREPTMATLLLTIRGKPLAIHESKSSGTAQPSVPHRRLTIGGQVFWVSGPDSTPTISWVQSGTRVTLDNYKAALDRSEALDLVQSMHPARR